MKIKPASILASIQNRGKLSGHKPQTETQTPGPASLGTAQGLSAPKASVVSGVLACFGLPSSPLSAAVHRPGQLLPSTADAKFTKHLAPNTNV